MSKWSEKSHLLSAEKKIFRSLNGAFIDEHENKIPDVQREGERVLDIEFCLLFTMIYNAYTLISKIL